MLLVDAMATATSLRLFPPAGGVTQASTPYYYSGSTLRFAGSTVLRDRRRLFRRSIALVSSSVVAYPHEEPSAAALADACVDKVLRVEMMLSMTDDAMRVFLRAAYESEGLTTAEVDALLEAWTFDLRRGDVVLVGYDGWREVTTFILPQLGRIDIHGVAFMRATWRALTTPSSSRRRRERDGRM